MINIKLAANIFAAVSVAAVSVQKIKNLRKTEKVISEFREAIDNAVVDFRTQEVIAFNRAQDEISDRMLAGYYDEQTDETVRHDFTVLYANYLTK